MTEIKNIVVYCSSRDNLDSIYFKAGEEFGKCMVNANIDLIYGAGKKGIMGIIAKTVFEGGRKVLGIMPKFLGDEIHKGCCDGYGETIVVDTMHERKKLMSEKADAFIALPGGFGTMEELFEIIAWYHLGIHKKPIGILNTNHYYDKILEWINNSTKEGFMYDAASDAFVTDSDPQRLLEKIIEKAKAIK